MDDPAAVIGSGKQVDAAFSKTFDELQSLIDRLIAIAVTNLDRDHLQARLQKLTVVAA